jgi:hypothetical protein
MNAGDENRADAPETVALLEMSASGGAGDQVDHAQFRTPGLGALK